MDAWVEYKATKLLFTASSYTSPSCDLRESQPHRADISRGDSGMGLSKCGLKSRPVQLLYKKA